MSSHLFERLFYHKINLTRLIKKQPTQTDICIFTTMLICQPYKYCHDTFLFKDNPYISSNWVNKYDIQPRHSASGVGT